MGKQMKFPVSFKRTETELYNWCRTKVSACYYVKELIKKDKEEQEKKAQEHNDSSYRRMRY